MSGSDISIPAAGLFVIIFSLCGYACLCGIIHVSLLRVNAGKGPPSTEDSLWQKLVKTPQFWYRALFLVMATVIGAWYIQDTCTEGSSCSNWHLIYWYSLLFVVTANISNRPYEFYLGEGQTLMDIAQFYLKNKPLATEEEMSKRVIDKYKQSSSDGQTASGIGFWTLMPSAFITWIFAKSIRNSSVLGARFGMLGGFAYDSWYLSFFSSSIVCYILRTRFGFQSLPTAVFKNYGALAVLCFQFCVLFRLFNEVWSNSTVIGKFYGAEGTDSYWGATWFSVLVPSSYVVMGGMRVSLFSDVFQAALAVIFLVVILGSIAADTDFSSNTSAFEYSPSEKTFGVNGWQPGWWAYSLAGTLGGMLSYPWFDPVLTDRAFLGKPKVMLASFFVGGFCAMLFIFFYAVIGVYGAWLKEKYIAECDCIGGLKGPLTTDACNLNWNPCEKLVGTTGEASDVAWLLGQRTYRGVEIFVNLVMITASLSTLDSTFTSASKLVSLEFCGWLRIKGDKRTLLGPLRPVDLENISETHIQIARAFIIFLMFAGNSFLGHEKDAMSATTVAGMAIMGIGLPIWWMTIWRTRSVAGTKGWRQAPLAFIVPFFIGWFFAISYYLQGRTVKEGGAKGWTYDLNIGTYTLNDGTEVQNAYGRYLGTMLLGHGSCVVAFLIFFFLHQVLPMTAEVDGEDVTEIGMEIAAENKDQVVGEL